VIFDRQRVPAIEKGSGACRVGWYAPRGKCCTTGTCSRMRVL